MEVHSLYELNEHIRRIIALNFPEPIWVKGEIAQADLAKGHYFIDLIEKSEEGITARADAVIWERTHRKLFRMLGRQFQALLQEGMEVMVKVKIDFNERYGYKLIVEDIDPSYTIGQLEIQKRKALEQLESSNLLHVNQSHPLPIVIQNVAILSSVKAAGLKDFLHQLQNNLNDYHINTQVFDATLQGSTAPANMVKKLKQINKLHQQFDCVAIIRGGGARLDLNAFNNFELCKQIAQMKLPVLTGIGHETDETLADVVAHTRLKTPTAVADYIIHYNEMFEGTIIQLEQQLHWLLQQNISQNLLLLQQLEEKLILPIQRILMAKSQELSFLEGQLEPLVKSQLKNAQLELHQLERLNNLLDINNTLARGYSITLKEKTIIYDSVQLSEGDNITTLFKKGKIESKVTKEKE